MLLFKELNVTRIPRILEFSQDQWKWRNLDIMLTGKIISKPLKYGQI